MLGNGPAISLAIKRPPVNSNQFAVDAPRAVVGGFNTETTAFENPMPQMRRGERTLPTEPAPAFVSSAFRTIR